MSKPKNRTPQFVTGCLVVAIIFVVFVVMASVLFLHIPSAQSLYERTKDQSRLKTVLIDGEYGLDVSQLSEQSRNIYLSLQSTYQLDHATPAEDEDEAAELGEPFPCLSILEYYSTDEPTDSDKYVYGMLLYTDGIVSAYDVFTTYYRIAGEQGVDFSGTDYFLFVRGNAVFVGNNRAFLKAYMNNIF